MTAKDHVRLELLEGPSTSQELSAISGISVRLISAYLGQLEEQREVSVYGQRRNDNGGMISKIYELTAVGRKRALKLTPISQ